MKNYNYTISISPYNSYISRQVSQSKSETPLYLLNLTQSKKQKQKIMRDHLGPKPLEAKPLLATLAA